MKLIVHAKHVSRVDVTHISEHGLWLLTGDHELFISFNKFPQFQNISVSEIMNVGLINPNLLHWPDLKIDLAIDTVRCFPLMPPKAHRTVHTGRGAKV